MIIKLLPNAILILTKEDAISINNIDLSKYEFDFSSIPTTNLNIYKSNLNELLNEINKALLCREGQR